jgi:vitamin B12/bleomycin/antimicrobial peptide transport system ATP-binding/permease protein
VVNRLAAFEESCEKTATKPSDDQPQIDLVEDDSQIALKKITLVTPDRARVLQQNISLAVTDGDSLLLTGPTGAGKTSLMRAVAGLWRAGNGEILRPSPHHILFMPQKPYLILGSICQQIQYPRVGSMSDETLMEMLREVDLAYLPVGSAALTPSSTGRTCCRAASSNGWPSRGYS